MDDNGIATAPLAAKLKLAEEYYGLMQDLDAHLRAGFVGITGNRLGLRNGATLLVPDTWPQRDTAETEVVSGENRIKLKVQTKSELLLRQWNGGFKPSADLIRAQDEFRTVLDLALQVSKLRMALIQIQQKT